MISTASSKRVAVSGNRLKLSSALFGLLPPLHGVEKKWQKRRPDIQPLWERPVSWPPATMPYGACTIGRIAARVRDGVVEMSQRLVMRYERCPDLDGAGQLSNFQGSHSRIQHSTTVALLMECAGKPSARVSERDNPASYTRLRGLVWPMFPLIATAEEIMTKKSMFCRKARSRILGAYRILGASTACHCLAAAAGFEEGSPADGLWVRISYHGNGRIGVGGCKTVSPYLKYHCRLDNTSDGWKAMLSRILSKPINGD